MKKKPNVIWVIADQMRSQAMSYHGDPNVRTPNIDRLAIEGVDFTQALSGTPLCSPFRGSLITGKYPHESSVEALNSPLSTEMPTVAHTLKENGYNTCWIGKWHLDGDRPELDVSLPENKKQIRQIPPERRGGFESWWAYENNNQPFNCTVHTDNDEGEMESFRLEGYESDALTDIMINWLEKQVSQDEDANKPFFACLSLQPPHDPYVAPAECMKNYNPAQLKLRPNVPNNKKIEERSRVELAGYYAAIERVDWNLGRLRKTLLDLGIDQDTYIIFFSDHGDLHGSHGQFRKMAPWEEAIKIPFIVGGPTRESHLTKTVDFPINHVDIAPTTLGICGINTPDYMRGFDYSSYVLGYDDTQQLPPDSAYLSLPVPTATQEGVILEEGVDRPFRGIVTRCGWKYVVLENQEWLMFNLNEDPYEQVNLALNPFYKDKRKELQERLLLWINETNYKFQV